MASATEPRHLAGSRRHHQGVGRRAAGAQWAPVSARLVQRYASSGDPAVQQAVHAPTARTALVQTAVRSGPRQRAQRQVTAAIAAASSFEGSNADVECTAVICDAGPSSDGPWWRSERSAQPVCEVGAAASSAPAAPLAQAGGAGGGRKSSQSLWTMFSVGALTMLLLQFLLRWLGSIPPVRRFFQHFFWWLLPKGGGPDASGGGPSSGDEPETTAMVLYTDVAESVEWVNMCWRKAWRVYQRGLERWLADLLQPVFDNLVADGQVPRFVQRLRILEFTLDHEAPYFDNMRRRTSRKDSDLNGVVDVRYTGGARLLLQIEVGQGRWRFKLPVQVSDLDLECKMWIKVRLAPMCPYMGTVSLAFVGPPNIKVQLAPYNTVRLMRIPVLQAFLRKLLTVDLPALMVLPARLEINIPPAITAVAEAAVGRDAVMRAVASAVLQADALEHALFSALPLGPQSPAGGVMLPDSFCGELQVTLREARNLPVWGLPWQSNPYCRLLLGNQAVSSRREDDTSRAGRHRAPVWNQEFHFLVSDPAKQGLEVWVRDSKITGCSEVGYVRLPLSSIPPDGCIDVWLPLQPTVHGHRQEGEVLLELTYKPFEDDDFDSGYREAEAFAASQQGGRGITDVKSAADASSRAAVAASAAAAAVAVTKAAAARAAAKAVKLARRQSEEEAETKAEEAAAVSNKAAANANRRAARPAASSGGPGPNGGAVNGTSSSNGRGVNGSSGRGEWPLPPPPPPPLSRGLIPPDQLAEVAAGAGMSEPAMQRLLTKMSSMESLDEEEELLSQRISNDYLDKQSQLLFPPASVRVTTTADEDLPLPSGYLQPPTQPRPIRPPTQPTQPMQQDDGAPSSPTASEVEAEVEAVILEEQQYVEAQAAAATAANGGGSSGLAATAAAAAASAAAAVAASAAAAAASAVAAPAQQLQQQRSRWEARDQHDGGDSLREEEGDKGVNNSMLGWLPREEDPAAAVAAQDKLERRSRDRGYEAAKPDRDYQVAKQDVRYSSGEVWPADGGAEEADKKASGKNGGRWWSGVTGWVSSLRGKQSGRADGDDDDDGNASAQQRREGRQGGGKDGPLESVSLPPNLPIEAIAEEVQNSWKLKEVHVENLLRRAVKRSERPWLILLTMLSASAVVLLVVVFYRLDHL